MRRILYALIPLTLALSSCTSTGVQVDERALTSFEKGKATIADVVARLGQPTSNMLLNTGQRIIGYTYIQAQARPESFIPIIGPLVGGADSHFSNAHLRSTAMVCWSPIRQHSRNSALQRASLQAQQLEIAFKISHEGAAVQNSTRPDANWLSIPASWNCEPRPRPVAVRV